MLRNKYYILMDVTILLFFAVVYLKIYLKKKVGTVRKTREETK